MVNYLNPNISVLSYDLIYFCSQGSQLYKGIACYIKCEVLWVMCYNKLTALLLLEAKS